MKLAHRMKSPTNTHTHEWNIYTSALARREARAFRYVKLSQVAACLLFVLCSIQFEFEFSRRGGRIVDYMTIYFALEKETNFVPGYFSLQIFCIIFSDFFEEKSPNLN